MASCFCLSSSAAVEIDTFWNVKQGARQRTGRKRVRRNRYILECKVLPDSNSPFYTGGRNRYILECKVGYGDDEPIDYT